MTIKLLPCPFCGEGNSQVGSWFDDVARRWRVGCGRCGCSTGTHRDKTKNPAIKAWNTRNGVLMVENEETDDEKESNETMADDKIKELLDAAKACQGWWATDKHGRYSVGPDLGERLFKAIEALSTAEEDAAYDEGNKSS